MDGTVGVPGPGLLPSGVPSGVAKSVGGRAVRMSAPGLLGLGVLRLPGLLLPPTSGMGPGLLLGGRARLHAIMKMMRKTSKNTYAVVCRLGFMLFAPLRLGNSLRYES